MIEFCRVLNETPVGELPEALEPLVDIDGLLWFLALDNGLINSDGYWTRASDYSIYLDDKNKFHFIPHDMNEAFRGAGGPGMRGPGRRGGGPRDRGFGPPTPPPDGQANQPPEERRPGKGEVEEGRNRGQATQRPLELDPLIGMDDTSKPLRSKVLAVPRYCRQYLAHVRELAEKELDWKTLEPFIAKQVAMIGDEIRKETRKLGTYDAFVAATILDESLAQDVKQWSRSHLGIDPHCCPSQVDGYDVHTL